MSNKKKGETRDEVEELLRAAEEEMLLKLSVDSHMSRVSPSYIDPDLHRRFQALKNPSSSSSSSSSSSVVPTKRETTIAATEKKTEERDTQYYKSSQENDEMNSVLGDDLFARFSALKASISSLPPKTSDGFNQFNQPNGNGDEDDEVEKVIQWAIDAARLDPSSPTDDDDDDDEDDDKNDEDSNDDSDNDGDRVDGDKRVKGK